jgi:hypothetical protein
MNGSSISTVTVPRPAVPPACPDCGGTLHAANYLRKPRGWLIALGEEHNLRFSFCCAVDGCRDRATPPQLTLPRPQGLPGDDRDLDFGDAQRIDRATSLEAGRGDQR